MKQAMAVNRRSVKVKKEVIMLFDLMNDDFQIEDCYEVANNIIIKEKLSDQKTDPLMRADLLKMRVNYLNSK